VIDASNPSLQLARAIDAMFGSVGGQTPFASI